MEQMTESIEVSHERWVPRVVGAILGTNDPASVAEVLVDAVRDAPGEPCRRCSVLRTRGWAPADLAGLTDR